MSFPRLRALLAIATLGVAPVTAGTMLAQATPAAATPGYVVTVGDSYISGEAGRWAGNTSTLSTTAHDALGADAYFDNAAHTAEQIAGCHRSESAEAHIASGVPSLNLACSGATTTTQTGSSFKPGIDFYNSGGQKGQALMLQEFATTHDVDMIVVSIGGNDFNFASIVSTCVSNFLLSSSLWPNYCYDDSSVAANFTSANVSAKTTAIAGALGRIRTAMTNAGYAQNTYTIVVQTYPSPLPNGSGIRYSQSGYTRQSTGGCGFWNTDANWANSTALPTINTAVRNAVTQAGGTNIKVLNLDNAYTGRRLCETGVGLLEEKSLTSWTGSGAANKTEWVNQIRTVSAAGTPYEIQESFHPNYWGQLAVRNCVRSSYNNGAVRGGTCSRGSNTGLNSKGEPNMTFTP